MPFIVKDTGGEVFTPDEGTYVCRCYGLVDIGTQSSQYGDKHQFILLFELLDCLHMFDESVGPQPVGLSRFFTASMNEKSNLRKFLAAWRGKKFTPEELKAFDVEKLVGATGQMTVTHKIKQDNSTSAFVENVSRLHPSIQVPGVANANQKLFFSFAQPDSSAWDRIPEWIKNKAKLSPEFRAWSTGMDDPQEQVVGQGQPVPDDDIPF